MTDNATDKKNEIESYEVPNIDLSKKMLNKLDEQSKKYPIWNAITINEVVGGTVENVEFLEHLNQNTGGYILRIINHENNRFVVFPNKVMVKKLLNICPTGELIELTDKKIFIQFDGEKQPRDERLKPYKTYTVIEDN